MNKISLTYLNLLSNFIKTFNKNIRKEEMITPKPKPINYELANILTEMGDYEKNVNQKIHIYYAYRKAAHSVMNYPEKITSGKHAKEILPGVGKKIALMIDEYLNTGTISTLEEERKNPKYGSIKELVRVAGIGPTHANKFIEMGLNSLEDLKNNTEKLNHHQKIGLKYVYDFENKIPREEMCQIRDFITQEIKSVDEKYSVTMCGSFRRGAASSFHVDILLTHPMYVSSSFKIKSEPTTEVKNEPKSEPSEVIETELPNKNETASNHLLENVIKRLLEKEFLTDTFALGGTKFNGVCQLKPGYLHRLINIRLIPNDEYIFGLFYYTGSFDFSKEMRKIASKKGFKLNEYWLKRVHRSGHLGKPMKVTCEKDIFDYLGMEYKSPEQRNM